MPESTRTKIIGDVTGTTAVKLDSKGGRLVASLLPRLGRKMNMRNQLLSGATLEFEDGNALVLLSGDASRDRKIVVTKKGADRFEIHRGTAGATNVDEVETAFLKLKIDQFASGALKLAPAVNAKQWADMMRQRLERAQKAFESAQDDLAQA